MDVTFHWNDAALRELLQGPNGGVARDLARRATAVETQAKLNASGRPGPRVQTGRLRASITHVVETDSQGVYADIGTAVDYGAYLELGTSQMRPYPFLVPALKAAG